MKSYVPRTLSYLDAQGDRQRMPEENLGQSIAPAVILGEPGMGKTELLRKLSERPGYVFITAKALLRRSPSASLVSDGETLVIDALDEVASASEDDPVHQVLARLARAGAPPFVMSCRAADWLGAIAHHDIAEDYGRRPLELRLEPLSRDDACAYLSIDLGIERARAVVAELVDRSFDPIYGNPLTLSLIASILEVSGELPEGRADLYERSCALLWREKSPFHARSPLSRLDQSTALNAAGAACAALIITGSEAISLVSPGCVAEGDLHVSAVAALPSATAVSAILRSGLFRRAEGEDRLVPLHRAIAEYLGAQWLAGRLPEVSARRVLGLLNYNGGVPASLRGIHAWLAHFNADVALDVIDADPYGVLRYGDANRMTPREGRRLLQSLQRLSEEDPYFRSGDWSRHVANGLTQVALLEDLRRILVEPGVSFQFRVLVLQSLKGAEVSEFLSDELHRIVMCEREDDFSYSEREVAGEALLSVKRSEIDWGAVIGTLSRRESEDDRRLAVELITAAGVAKFSTQVTVFAALAYLGLMPDLGPKGRAVETIGPLYFLARSVPAERIASLLDLLVTYAPVTKGLDWSVRYALNDFVNTLIARQIEHSVPQPLHFLRWLRLVSLREAHSSELRKEISRLLLNDVTIRRAIQSHVLLVETDHEDVWGRAWRLVELDPALRFSPEDVASLLVSPLLTQAKDPERRAAWKDLVRLAASQEGLPEAVLTAAMSVAGSDAELGEYLRQLAKPRIPDWERQQRRREKAEVRARERRWASDRAAYLDNQADVRVGGLQWIVPLADAYFGPLYDMDVSDSPRGRIGEWLGEDLLAVALVGFEAVLHRQDLPSSTAVAESYAASRRWHYIGPILAGMCERVATRAGIDGVSDDVLLAACLGLLWEHPNEASSVEALKSALDGWLATRPDLFERYARLAIESQFQREESGHVFCLHQILQHPAANEIACQLAAEWLSRFAAMNASAELELIDHLTRSGRWSALREIASRRRQVGYRDNEHRLTWLAVSFLVEFDDLRDELDAAAAEHAELFWHIRNRGGVGRADISAAPNGALDRLVWIVRTFRGRYPLSGRPRGVMSGSENSWNATEFLEGCIRAIAADTSNEAICVLGALRDQPGDGYTPGIRNACAEQIKARRENDFNPASLSDLLAVTSGQRPRTTLDLRAIAIDHLEKLQRRLRGDDVGRVKLFHGHEGPRDENSCRDALAILLQDDLPFGIDLIPERSMPRNRRADLVLLLGDLQLPVEIKGQWNRDLWSAAMSQLDAYAHEWRASGAGIYLIFWFGPEVPPVCRLRSPPRPLEKPSTPQALAEAVIKSIPEHRRADLSVFVLDVSL